MTARPIFFSAPMVRALLAGTKTQTRRLVKGDLGWLADFEPGPVGPDAITRCPYGAPGDLLWVRESGLEHRKVRLFTHDATPGKWWTDDNGGRYGATYSAAITRASLLRDHRVRPSIHMPRWASRLTLEVTGVRIERLNDCSEDDAISEGVTPGATYGGKVETWLPSEADRSVFYPSARQAYAALWRTINGPDSWAANPWVWVVEFAVHQANVDAVLIALRQASEKGRSE